jgi:hypothetical protein
MERRERTGIEFPDATWTSSDRYDRYGAIARCLRASLGEGRHRVLDVGDAAGYLRLFAGDLQLVGVDMWVQPDRLPGAIALAGDGGRLPFADGTFDAVVSSDVLEHVPAEARPGFLAELSRVSRDLVIVAAPFDTDGVAGVEEVIRRYVPIVTGAPQDQLDEHMDNGLPDLAATAAVLEAHGQVAVVGNGNLWDWLELMLVKHQLMARPALQPFHDGIDLLCNLSMAGRAGLPPFYRHLVVARRSAAPQLGEMPEPPLAPERASAMIASLLSAAGPESTRQDVVPLLGEVATRASALEARVDGLQAEVHARLDAIDAQLAELREHSVRVMSVLDRLGSPLRKIRGRGDQPG